MDGGLCTHGLYLSPDVAGLVDERDQLGIDRVDHRLVRPDAVHGHQRRRDRGEDLRARRGGAEGLDELDHREEVVGKGADAVT